MSADKLLVVFDTNVLVSGLLLPSSVPAKALKKATSNDILLFSKSTFAELIEVLYRSKFDRYLSNEDRKLFIAKLGNISKIVPILRKISICRDPKDDQFLDVVLNGDADLLISGDVDLLSLKSYQGKKIVKPVDYLAT